MGSALHVKLKVK